MKKRGVLSLWKVIILVIVGIIGVAGVSVLSLYLMGKFDEAFVEPENISFVKQIDEGSGYYNETLGQYEVASNFEMTITTTTENVTEKKITLSLAGGSVLNGYVSDGIITVPQEVEINKPFTVSLNTEYNADSHIMEDWIVGGKSVLTAKSTNVLISAETTTICVDVPVHSIDVQVSGTDQTGDVQDVVIGTSFNLDTIFYPEQSKYLFSDSTREKEIFYTFTSSYISYDWESETFFANQRSGNNTDSITVYTFANSYYQKQVMDMYSSITDRELLTSNVLRYFEQHSETCLTKTVNIKVLDIDVERVEVGNEGNSFSTYLDQYFTLTTASSNGNGKLDLSIKDSSGALLNSLFGNVGIKVPKNVDGLTILGGKVMEVVTTDGITTITQKDFDKDFDYAGAPDGTEYYVLPDSTPKDFADYYWRFASANENEYTLSINFFFENEEGNWENFFAFSGDTNVEKTVTLIAEEHDYEEEPAWQTNDTIMLTINYDEEGNPITSNKDLSKELNAINVDNIYKTIRFFLFIDENEVGYAENLNMQEAFSCGEGKLYTQDYKGQSLVIAGASDSANGYTLYEIDGSVLTALKSFSGKVKVIAALIKTDAENKPYLTEDGKYLIIKTSRVKDVMVESTLSIANMVPSISFVTGVTPNVDHNNDYYIPAINRNETASQRNMINFELVLNNSEDTETDSQKVISAFNSGNLKVACLDMNGQVINDYVTLQGLVEKSVEENTITFEGSLAIEEAYFSAGKNSLDKGTYIRLQLQYNDGKETYTKNVTIKDDTKNYFYIYYQQPVSMEAEFENQTDLDSDNDGIIDDIIVNITASNGISITWGNKEIAGTSEEVLQQLNDLLVFTLTDQFGNTIEDSSAIYSIRLVETPIEGTEENILSLDSTLSKIQNFVSTQGQEKTTTLTAYIVDKEDNYVYAFDDEGNVTGNRMASQTLTFRVQSEGVKEIKYDPTDTVNTITEDQYVSSSSLSQVTISKYVTSNQTIDMNTLLKVYTSGADGDLAEAKNIVFKLDDGFISGLSSTNKVDIMKMIKFNSLANVEATENVDTIENYRNTNIGTINIINPFKEDAQIVFSVRDENESLFNITLILVLKADISISQGFNAYYEENSDYLVTNGNAISVFAGQSYDISEYLTLTSHLGASYSWVASLGALSLTSDPSGVFYSDNEDCYLTTVKENDIIKQILLTFDDLYKFQTINVTLYYGVNSFYACSITISFYVNPNIIVRQMTTEQSSNPYLDLEGLNSSTLGTYYKLYKATDYIENDYSFDGVEELKSNNNTGNIAFVYSNKSSDKYISVEASDDDANVYNLYYVKDAILHLTLGQKVEQQFEIYAELKGSSTRQKIDAIKIVDNGTDKEIILCEKTDSLYISIDIGFGSNDNATLASAVLRQSNGGEVNVVTYNGEIYLLLLSGSKYETQNNFSISVGSETGELYSNSKYELSTYGIGGFISLEGNGFDAEQILSDSKANPMTIIVSLKAIVSKIGDKFVYYNNEELPEQVSDMEFNVFGDKDFSVIIGDYTGLESENVYQSLQAGNTYTIIHDSSKEIDSTDDAFGFYYDGDATEINTDSASYELSIVEDANGYINGLATLKVEEGNLFATQLEINHLESAVDNAYIVLKLEISQHSGGINYVWYYRIKVEPSFTKGAVIYPYSDFGEYLDTYSRYFDSQTLSYKINLEEPFTPSNSKYSSGKRFGDIAEWIDLETEPTFEAKYSIKNVKIGESEISNYQNYFTYSFDGGNFEIKLVDNSAKLTVVIEKSFYVNNLEMIGGEMLYTLYFNQGQNYVHTLKQISGDEEQKLNAVNNKYETTVYAGSDEVVFVPDIKISSNGTESKVKEFSAYISGENIVGSLMLKSYIKAGSKIYTDDTATTTKTTLKDDLVVGEWKDSVEDFTANEHGIVSLSDTDGTVYYVDKASISWAHAYLDGEKQLHIKPQETVRQDNKFEIGFYTDERIVFTIDLTVTSYFKWQINSGVEFKGGERYTISSGDNNIFSMLTIDENLSSLTISDFNLALKNGNEVYDYFKTSDTEIQLGKTYYLYSAENGTYSKVETPTVENLANYYEALLLSDLVYINNDEANYADNTVEFAHLLKDATFVFEGTITDSNTDTSNNTYTFTFELKVKASFVLEQTRRVVDTTERYGNVNFDVTMEKLRSSINDLMPIYDAPDGSDPTKSAYSYVVDGEYLDTVTITPENVASSSLQEKSYVVAYTFNDKQIFSFNVSYRFTVNKNVEVTANYPSPDNTTVLNKEYIATTQGTDEKFVSEVFNGFFTSVAPFGKENRIVVKNIVPESVQNGNTLAMKWNVSVASINNAIVYITGDTSKSIDASSDDMKIVTDVDNINNLNVQFSIVNSSSNATVMFDVTVNSVTTTYTVEIVPGSNIKISTNTPNYTNNRENVYAEDLAGQSSQYLFEQNRILSYSFKASVVVGTSYYLRFTNSKNEVQVVAITANTLNQIVNVDLGKSYTGYSYVGTFTSKESAENNSASSQVQDDTIYLSVPTLTSRIVAYYYDNTPIVLTDNITLQLKQYRKATTFDAGTEYYVLQNGAYIKDENPTADKLSQYYVFVDDVNAETFTLTKDDYGTTTNMLVSLKMNSKEIQTSGAYNLYLDIEFDVTGNADNSQNYTTVEVNAGVVRNLFSYSSFGITNSRTGLAYDATSMFNSMGTFNLEIYGFADTIHVDKNSSDPLAKTAGIIDESLRSTIGKDLTKEIVYATGLTPRAGDGMIINEIPSSGDLKNNYIAISGIINNRKIVDFNIFAQGASNDGNYVMMRITYSVEINGENITEAHNLLFKVMPNSSIRFKSQYEDAQNYISSSTEIVNGQTVATNSIAPYGILLTNQSSNQIEFNLWETSGLTNVNSSSIIANMYGESTNSANAFKYTYVDEVKEGYNDKTSLIESTFGSGWSTSGKTYIYNENYSIPTKTSLMIELEKINLGSRSFIFELQNIFGYKAYFYFTITAEVNPTIYSMSNASLNEGSSIGVGLRFQTVTPSTSNEGYVMFESFNYSKDTTENANFINDINIHLTNYAGNYRISTAKLEVTIKHNNGGEQLPAGTIITKTWTPTVDDYGNIKLSIIEDGNKWYKDGTEVVGIEVNSTIIEDASCILSLNILREEIEEGEEEKPIGYYDVKYGNNVLKQSHTISSGFASPDFSEANVDTQVSLSGISAYGYSNSLSAVNVDSVSTTTQSTVSKTDAIQVKKIEFYLGDTWLGGTYRTESGIVSKSNISGYNDSNAKSVKLVTNANYSFVTEVTGTTGTANGTATISKGEVFDESKEFTVPIINGFYYGTGTTLSNVKMNITLVDTASSSGEECVISSYVTLNRAASTNGLFDSTIYDTKSPTIYKIKSTYNDTLEVVLDAGESITFVVNDKDIDSVDTQNKVITVGGETKNINFVTLTNSKEYTVTEYIGISASISGLTENLKQDSAFYIYATEMEGAPVINYNATTLAFTEDKDEEDNIVGYKTNGTIGVYENGSGALVMNIENENELSFSNVKTETLYFIYRENEQNYQYSCTFTVKPYYESAEATQGNYFQVDDYYKVSNATTGNTYYIIPRATWGVNIKLKGFDDNNLANTASYRIYFDINSTGGTGSAFIDENGMITTTEQFDIAAHYLVVNIYAKFSGTNGAFDEDSTRIMLGSYIIYLKTSANTSTDSKAEGIYKDDKGNIIIIPEGYKLVEVYEGSSALGTGLTSITEGEGSAVSFTYAIEAGQTIDFAQVYSESSDQNYGYKYNTTYHLAKYDDTYVYFDNLDKWTFSNAGNYTITMVVTGRNEISKAIDAKLLTANIIVYETSTKEEQQYYGSLGTNFFNEDMFDQDYDYYEINENGSVSKVESSITFEKIGIYTKTYIAQSKTGGETKIVTKTFYVYQNSGYIQKYVALQPFTTFQLSNLVEGLAEGQSVEFYKEEMNSISRIVAETFSKAINSESNSTYIVVVKNSEGTIVSVDLYKVNYKFISADVSDESLLVTSTTNLASVVKEKVAESLGIETTQISTVEIRNSNGVLETETRSVVDLGGNIDLYTERYVITYKDNQNKTKFARFTFNFYIYKSAIDHSVETSIDNAYRLSNLNDEISKLIGGIEASDILGYYQLKDNSLQQVNTTVLEENKTEEYYVRTSVGYYLVKINFSITQ